MVNAKKNRCRYELFYIFGWHLTKIDNSLNFRGIKIRVAEYFLFNLFEKY